MKPTTALLIAAAAIGGVLLLRRRASASGSPAGVPGTGGEDPNWYARSLAAIGATPPKVGTTNGNLGQSPWASLYDPQQDPARAVKIFGSPVTATNPAVGVINPADGQLIITDKNTLVGTANAVRIFKGFATA